MFLATFSSLTPFQQGAIGAGVVAFVLAFLALFVILGIAVYIYSAMAWMRIASRTRTEPAWLSWIPVANLYLQSKIARKHWWPLLLLIITAIPFIGGIASIVFMVFMISWKWKSFERFQRPGWWSLFIIIPVLGWIVYLILLGIVAWGKK